MASHKQQTEQIDPMDKTRIRASHPEIEGEITCMRSALPYFAGFTEIGEEAGRAEEASKTSGKPTAASTTTTTSKE